MKPMNRFLWLFLAAALLASTGCIELTGQRISWFYDQRPTGSCCWCTTTASTTPDRCRAAVERIPRFVNEGGVMFADWFGQIRMADLRKQAE